MKVVRIILTILLIGQMYLFSTNAGSDAQGTLDFYGHQRTLTFDYQLKQFRLHQLDQAEFNHWSKHFRQGQLQPLLRSIQGMRRELVLDDIGTSLLVDKVVQQQFGTDRPNEAVLIQYLLLKELGYDVLLTKTGNSLNCMGNLSFKPGRYISIRYNNKEYKDLDFSKRKSGGQHFIYMDRMHTYRTLNRNILQLPKLTAKRAQKEIDMVYMGDSISLHATSNLSIVEFLQDIPMYDIGREYTRLHMSPEMRSTLVRELRMHTRDMSKADQALFLLAFAQQIVPYGSDYEAYGEERYNYPEQTVMASAADCEDKTFLLSYLLREVAQLESVALFYAEDEHLSLGIHIPDYSDAYSFKYKGKYYLSVEPTAKQPRLGYAAIPLKRVTRVMPL